MKSSNPHQQPEYYVTQLIHPTPTMGYKCLLDRDRNNGIACRAVPMYDIGAYTQQAGVSTIKLLL